MLNVARKYMNSTRHIKDCHIRYCVRFNSSFTGQSKDQVIIKQEQKGMPLYHHILGVELSWQKQFEDLIY